MANNVQGRQWFLDTASAVTPVFKGQVLVKYIKWNSPAAIGDLLIIKDRNGVIVLHAKAEAVAGSQHFNIENWVEDFFLDTLTAGSLGVTVHIK